MNEKYFDQYNCSYYLFNACENGNIVEVEYLVEHGMDITIKDKNNKIVLDIACSRVRVAIYIQ